MLSTLVASPATRVTDVFTTRGFSSRHQREDFLPLDVHSLDVHSCPRSRSRDPTGHVVHRQGLGSLIQKMSLWSWVLYFQLELVLSSILKISTGKITVTPLLGTIKCDSRNCTILDTVNTENNNSAITYNYYYLFGV